MYQNLAYVAVFVFIYSISSGGLERTPINGAIVYTVFGLVFGNLGFGLLNINVDAESFRTLAELTLALVLFIDAANANLGTLKQHIRTPWRLLFMGLPLTILLGFGIGVMVFDDLTMLEIAILATMLAPTDAALGKAVVTDKSVPGNIRESLNVESGLNDGICVPILFVFIALATGANNEVSTSMLTLSLVTEQIGIGLVVGVGLTLLATRLFKEFAERSWVTETWRQLPVVALAMACFAIAQILGGSGFIAAFVGGILFGWLTQEHKHKHTVLLAAEGTGDTMALMTWVAFGASVIGKYLDFISWQVVVYSLLSLTVVRMVPVFLVLSRLNFLSVEKLFIGWFGPRGLASIVFAVIVLNENLPGANTISTTVVCTIILSVIAHGLSAKPLIKVLEARIKVRASQK